MTKSDFRVKRTSHGDYIVIYIPLDTHGHFVRQSSAYELIDWLVKGILPKSEYFRKCAQRLLPDELYNTLRPCKYKQKFNNRSTRYG